MQLKFKKLIKKAITPTRAYEHAAGFDLYALGNTTMYNYSGYPIGKQFIIGIAVEIPEGFVGLLLPRSSSPDRNIAFGHSVGIIDADYRGEILVRYVNYCHEAQYYRPGDKCAQLVIVPQPKFDLVEVDELSETLRGQGGFGSSGV